LETPMFTFEGIHCKAKCVKCYDGDTVHLCFKYEGGKPLRHRCRLAGIDTPEMRSKDPQERAVALLAKTALEKMILDRIVTVDFGPNDMYGRPLVTIRIGNRNVNQKLIDKGLATSYQGKTKTPFKDWYKNKKFG